MPLHFFFHFKTRMMKFYWIKTNLLIKKMFSNYVWDIPNTENKIYLTFDDGPTPEITDWVLEQLKKFDAKATFFCIGNNIEKYPEIFEKVIANDHSIGNHTFDHVNGWKTSTDAYIKNSNHWSVVSGQNCQLNTEHCKLFRPPYGKIKTSQSKKLLQLGYKIIMWDVLSADFDSKVSKEKCLENVKNNVTAGSIIVFHDSVKAFSNLEYTLPRALQYWTAKGFEFESIK